MGKFLQECADDAWEVIQGRKKIVGNKVVESTDLDVEKKDTEYGWLEPNGNFHVVDFGKHQTWAAKYLLELVREGKIAFEEARVQKEQNVGDLLVKRGWVLVHNPSQMNITITRDLSKRLTKVQKNFLYKYLCKYGREKEANELYNEE